MMGTGSEATTLERDAAELRLDRDDLRRELAAAAAESERLASALAVLDVEPRVWLRVVAMACAVAAAVIAAALAVGVA